MKSKNPEVKINKARAVKTADSEKTTRKQNRRKTKQQEKNKTTGKEQNTTGFPPKTENSNPKAIEGFKAENNNLPQKTTGVKKSKPAVQPVGCAYPEKVNFRPVWQRISLTPRHINSINVYDY